MKKFGIPSRLSRRIQKLRRSVFDRPAEDEPSVTCLPLQAVVVLSALLALFAMQVRELSIGDATMVFMFAMPILGILGLVLRPVIAFLPGVSQGGPALWGVVLVCSAAAYWFSAGQNLHTH